MLLGDASKLGIAAKEGTARSLSMLDLGKRVGKNLLVVDGKSSRRKPKQLGTSEGGWRDVCSWVLCLIEGVSRRIVC